MPLKTSDEKQDLILKVFDYFEAESKLSLGESEMNISCMLGFWWHIQIRWNVNNTTCVVVIVYTGSW